MEERKKLFLETHREKLIQNIRNPSQLADALFEKNDIDNELYKIIRNKITEQEQNREIFLKLNTTLHFAHVYDWVKEKESGLLKELENCDPEAAAPQKKRARRESADETDYNITGFPDLKLISTFAKLENWVSDPNISQNLLSDLRKKLTEKSMADLEKELKYKEPKKSLCFNADNIDEIRKNKELDIFLCSTKDATFPKLALKMFFKKCGSASSGNKAQSSTDHEETMDTITDLESSGYGSLLSSSFNDSNCSRHFDRLRQNDKILPDEDTLTVCNPTGDKDIKIHENKDIEIESKTNEQHHRGSYIQMHHEVKADEPSKEPMDSQDNHIDEMEEQAQRSDVSRHEDVSLQKKERPQEDGLGRMEIRDTHIRETDEEPQRSYGPNDPRYEDVFLHQNKRFTKKETQLEDGKTDKQDTHIREADEEPQRSYGPNNPRYEDDLLLKDEQFTKKERPQEDGLERMDMPDTHIKETDEEPHRSFDPNDTRHKDASVMRNESASCGCMIMQQNEQENMQLDPENKWSENNDNEFDSKTTEQHHRGSFIQMHHKVKADAPSQEPMDSQDTHIDEMEEQAQRSDMSRHEDVSLQKTEQFTKNERPQEDGFGRLERQDTHIRETDEEPQRSCEPNDTRFENVFLHQNEQFTKKETQLEDGRMEMQDTHIREADEEPQRSYGPNNPRYEDDLLLQNEQFTKKERPQEDGLERMEMPDTHIREADEQPQRSCEPNDTRFENVFLHQNERVAKKETQLEDGLVRMDMQDTHIRDTDEEPERSYDPNDPRQQNDQENMQLVPEPFSQKQAQNQIKATKRRGNAKSQNEKKKEKDKLLLHWAVKQCNGSKEKLRNIFDSISIKNLVEHGDYPCFTAENVMVFTNSTAESQIIFITNDNTSISTNTMVNYQMFVCNIKKAIILSPKNPTEKIIEYAMDKVTINKYTDFVFKVFAPILAVFKRIQKEQKLYSLI